MRAEGSAGFTLIEVLVAMVVTSLLLVLVTSGAVSARERSARDRTRAGAIILARSLLEESSVQPYLPGQRHGSKGLLSWTLTEAPISADAAGQLILSEARVVVVDRDKAVLFSGALRTLKRVAT